MIKQDKQVSILKPSLFHLFRFGNGEIDGGARSCLRRAGRSFCKWQVLFRNHYTFPQDGGAGKAEISFLHVSYPIQFRCPLRKIASVFQIPGNQW